MKRLINLHLALVLSLGLLLLLLRMLDGVIVSSVHAAHSLHPVSAPGDVLCVAPEGGAYVGCTQVFTNVQAAVDAASGGETIKVAGGVYTGVSSHYPCFREVLCIGKSLSVQGGYTITNWEVPDFQNNPTVLDAQGQGRALAAFAWNMITLTLDGLQMTNGNAQGLYGDLDSYDAGGGAWFFSVTVSMRNCQVSNSYAQVGGGIYAHGSNVTLDNATLLHNAAQYWGGGAYADKSRANLARSTFLSNTAQYGGGLFLEESDAILDANTILSNSTTHGGGVYANECANPVLSKNKIIGNAASGVGGGVALNTSDARLINNIIRDNQAGVTGSGIYLVQGSSQLAHNTIANNHGGDGSGVTVNGYYRAQYNTYYPGTAAISNTILVSQTVGITVAANNTATVAGVLWFGNQANMGGEGVIIVTHEITGDPAFVDGYHILSSSLAYNAGIDSGVYSDIDNQPRPYQVPDLGADEYWPPGAPKYIYLPVVLR
jgi:hypothetical protein